MKNLVYFLLAGVFALGACSQDPLQRMMSDTEYTPDAPTYGVSEGSFVVNYGVDNGSTTRATGDGKLQISSLDYYVYYKSGGELVKHRSIRIDPETQVWPMKWENMTWEQRQALQDTLQCGVDYRILFIANIDSTLFNYGTYSDANPHPAVVKGDSLYGDARILLPNVPFREDNMYCLWEGELAASDTVAYRDQQIINRTDVRLQRIVTRTDVSRTETPTSLYDAIANGFYETNCRENVENAVDSWISDFCKCIDECANGILHVNDTEKLRENKDAVAGLIDILENTNSRDILKAYIKDTLVKQYESLLKPLYETHVQDWDRLASAHVNYESGQRANEIGFNLWGANNNEVMNIAPCRILIDDLQSGPILCFYGFEGSGLNSFRSISVQTEASFSYSFVSRIPFNTNQLKNTHSNVICDPVKFVWCKNDTPMIPADSDDENIELYNLIEALENTEAWQSWKNTFDRNSDDGNIVTIIDYFFDCYLHAGVFRNHDYSLSSFPFNINRPDLTTENVGQYIELESSWQ